MNTGPAAAPEPDAPPVRDSHVSIKAEGMAYLTRRAAQLTEASGTTTTPDDVARTALREYAERHPLRAARPAPKPDKSAPKGKR